MFSHLRRFASTCFTLGLASMALLAFGAVAASATTHRRVPIEKHAAKVSRKKHRHQTSAKPAKASAPRGVKAPTHSTTTTSATSSAPPSTPSSSSPGATADSPKASGIPQPTGVGGHWSLVLNSDFSSNSLNTSLWQTGWFGSGITNPVNVHEQDCYNSSNLTFPGDGTLHMGLTLSPSTCDGTGTPVNEPDTGSLISTNPNDGRTSGGFQYTYGVAEARIYVPGSNGTISNWPAFWTTGQNWPATGEDDIMEGLGGQACFHYHYGTVASPQAEGACDVSLRPGWHTFASDWKPGSITYYYDGLKVGQLTSGIASSPQYLILDNTTGDASWNGKAQADQLQVAYVRVWQAA